MKRKATQQDETQWIAAIRQGGVARERAIHAINLAYRGYLVQQKQKLKLSEEDALDCYTDAVVAISEHVVDGRFAGDSRLSTYFFRIFSNRCIDKLRANTTNIKKAQQDWSEAFVHLPDSAQSFLSGIMDREKLNTVLQFLDALGERCRKILWYSAYWGYSPQEIADKMNFSSPKSASSQRYQCLQALKKNLKAAQYEI